MNLLRGDDFKHLVMIRKKSFDHFLTFRENLQRDEHVAMLKCLEPDKLFCLRTPAGLQVGKNTKMIDPKAEV